MATSDACKNQAFQLGKTICLHINDLIKNCSDELSGGGDYVQSREKILSHVGVIAEMNGLMARFLGEVERRYGG